MKKNYDKDIELICITCGDKNFEYNDNKTWVKCLRCYREYKGGYDELVELNQSNIQAHLNKTKNEIKKDLEKDLRESFKKAFKGNKNIKFK